MADDASSAFAAIDAPSVEWPVYCRLPSLQWFASGTAAIAARRVVARCLASGLLGVAARAEITTRHDGALPSDGHLWIHLLQAKTTRVFIGRVIGAV